MSVVMSATALEGGFAVFTDYGEASGDSSYEFSYAEAPEYSITGSEGSTSFSELLSAEVAESAADQQADSNYTVMGVDIAGGLCTVDCYVCFDSTLVVGIYEEQTGRFCTTGSVDVFGDQSTASLSLNKELIPEYFIVKVFIIDPETMRPLVKEYISDDYSEAVMKFNALTVNDFEGQVVVNFDDDETDNFTVFGQDVNVFYENVSLETIEKEESVSTYSIVTSDDRIKSLSAGEKFQFPYGSPFHLLANNVVTLFASFLFA